MPPDEPSPGRKDLDLPDLLTTEFVATHTDQEDLATWLAASDLVDDPATASMGDDVFETDAWDAYVRESTDFPSWTGMLAKAIIDHVGQDELFRQV